MTPRPSPRASAAAAILAAVLAVPARAEAHLVNSRLGDFYNGVMHPLTAFEHVLPWVALGILAGMQPARCGCWMLLVFPVGLGAGAALALVFPGALFVPTANFAAFVVIGGLIAAAWAMPGPVLLGVGALLGLTQGYENAAAMTDETNRLLFVSGVTAIGYVLIALVTAATLAFLRGNQRWRQVVLRALGSWLAAIGIMLLGLRLAGR